MNLLPAASSPFNAFLQTGHSYGLLIPFIADWTALNCVHCRCLSGGTRTDEYVPWNKAQWFLFAFIFGRSAGRISYQVSRLSWFANVRSILYLIPDVNEIIHAQESWYRISDSDIFVVRTTCMRMKTLQSTPYIDRRVPPKVDEISNTA